MHGMGWTGYVGVNRCLHSIHLCKLELALLLTYFYCLPLFVSGVFDNFDPLSDKSIYCYYLVRY